MRIYLPNWETRDEFCNYQQRLPVSGRTYHNKEYQNNVIGGKGRGGKFELNKGV